MPRALQFTLFFSMFTAILGGIHYYVWARLVRDPAWPVPWSRAATIAIIVGAVSIPTAAVLGRLFQREWATPFYVAALLWFAIAGLLFAFFAATDALRLVAWAVAWVAGVVAGVRLPVDAARRLLLVRAVAGGAGATVAAMAAVGVRNALGEIDTKEVPVKMARLPKELSGLSIVQLTDVHVGPTIRKRFIEHIVEKTNALKPDLVAITGDLVDGGVDSLRDAVAPLTTLKSRYGTFFVTGNHEYFSGVDEWLAELKRMGIRVLTNERVSIGDNGASFDLAGVPDLTAKRSGFEPPQLDRALAGRDPERELVLLAHQPKALIEAAEKGVGLQLSGHTHGGQVWPFGAVVALTQPFISGFHRRGNTSIYVSCGTGYWGPPMRVGAPAEITRIVLT
jgi:uncharacterized protein